MRSAIVFGLLSCCGVTAQDDLTALLQRLRAAGEDDVPGCVAPIRDLGRSAAPAVPALFELFCASRSTASVDAYLALLGELLPFRAADALPDEATSRKLMRRAITVHHTRLLPTSASLYAYARFEARMAFPHTAAVPRLTAELSCLDALRIEAAVDVLSTRGAAARPALPALTRLLERPEPRILLTDDSVPIHHKVARALTSIAPELLPPEQATAEGARRAFGIAAPSASTPLLPERALQRIDELVADLDQLSTREAARDNLIALGEMVVPRLVVRLSPDRSPEALEATIEVLDALGPRAVAAVPAMLEALTALPAPHTEDLLDALVKAAPWSADVVLPITYAMSVGRFEINGTRLTGYVDAEVLNAVHDAAARLDAAMAVDPTSTLATLERHLSSNLFRTRERALVVLMDRGDAAASLLPTLSEMMRSDHPPDHVHRWTDDGKSTIRRVDRSLTIQRLAARAILKVAAPDATEVAEARALLDQGR